MQIAETADCCHTDSVIYVGRDSSTKADRLMFKSKLFGIVGWGIIVVLFVGTFMLLSDNEGTDECMWENYPLHRVFCEDG